MKPCIYRGTIKDGRAVCTNTKDLCHTGTVSLEICTHCPFIREPDFFAQTERLLLAKQTAGQYRPQPRSCGGCTSFKRRDDTLQFVWPYWHAGASADELRWSIRSVETNYDGPCKITIIGDRPPWYRGHVIEQARVEPQGNRGFRDMLAKMWTMASHPQIDSDFVWMMDDVYLIKPTTWDELDAPRAVRWVEDRRNSWQRRKSNTMRALRGNGHTNHDYATHLPHTVEKAKLRQLFSDYDLHQNTYLWEVLYGNIHRGKPWHPKPFFTRITDRISPELLTVATAEAKVLNHTAGAWCPAIRDYLSALLPTPARGEVEDSGYQPQWRRVTKLQAGRQRQVKRRPKANV
jgi:hypothetical protein